MYLGQRHTAFLKRWSTERGVSFAAAARELIDVARALHEQGKLQRLVGKLAELTTGQKKGVL